MRFCTRSRKSTCWEILSVKEDKTKDSTATQPDVRITELGSDAGKD